ncbi:MAG: ComEC/Rec2 family competence protein [Campylobacteraceae bacterium]|jgi:competence protein ComEC|nr:ComEC/Rec2 family competence protein [Campylobacteraceae bacterium]MBT7117614.1 ComEC/Rec2 family competence protein [Campylobacteraceae bacterium]
MNFDTEQNNLLLNKKQWYFFLFSLFIIFIINISIEYFKYKKFKNIEIQNQTAKVLSIYPKKDYFILKLKTSQFIFYTSKNDNKQNIMNQDTIDIDIITTEINFLDYLKGFYTKSMNIIKINTTSTLISEISKDISKQHNNEIISELFNALFLAIPIKQSLRDQCIDFGISHLIALSGFHLGVLSFILYWIFYFPYKYIHQNYFPFRNFKYDLLILTSVFLFGYLIFLDLVPSLLRAFIMYIFAIFLYRNNIKLISFNTLAITLLLIIVFIPKLIFSLSLWLSIFGVFYIFLFLKYFSHLNKIFLFIIFNIWIFLALNPIIHQFFNIGSLHQIYSAVYTIGFSIFYPIELFLHLIGQGGLLDSFIELWLNIKTQTFNTTTSIYFTTYYLILSLFSIKLKEAFWLLHLSFIGFTLYIFI